MAPSLLACMRSWWIESERDWWEQQTHATMAWLCWPERRGDNDKAGIRISSKGTYAGILAMLVGTLIGIKMAGRMKEQAFRKVTLAVVFLTGLSAEASAARLP